MKNKFRTPHTHPFRLFLMPNNELRAWCEYCNGGGKEWITTSSTNHLGTSESGETKNKCIHCGGTGYEKIAIQIYDSETKRELFENIYFESRNKLFFKREGKP